MRSQPDRGFSLFTVLLVLVMLALVSGATLMISTSQSGTAGARNKRRQALSAAEAGLSHFMGTAPEHILPNKDYIGGTGDPLGEYRYLPNFTDDSGNALQARYKVSSKDLGPISNSVIVISEGEILEDTRVVGKAKVASVVQATPGGNPNAVEHGQKGLGSAGTSSDLPTVNDISLIFDDSSGG